MENIKNSGSGNQIQEQYLNFRCGSSTYSFVFICIYMSGDRRGGVRTCRFISIHKQDTVT